MNDLQEAASPYAQSILAERKAAQNTPNENSAAQPAASPGTVEISQHRNAHFSQRESLPQEQDEDIELSRLHSAASNR